MSFETATYLSPSDLLQKMATRLSTDGWTIIRQNGLGGDGPLANNQLSISEGGNGQWNFIADDTAAVASISCQPSAGDSGAGVDYYAHSGSPNTSGSQGTTADCGQKDDFAPVAQGFEGSGTYWFFSGTTAAGDRYMHCVMEGVAGGFWQLHFGTCELAGAINGGQYVTGLNVDSTASHILYPFQAQNPNTSSAQWLREDDNYVGVSVTSDAGVSRWFQDFGQAGNFGGSNHMLSQLYQWGLQAWNQRTPMSPNWLTIWNSPTPGATVTPWKLIGHTPDMRIISMDQRDPKDIITLGSDDWHLFPVHVKNTDQLSTAYTNRNNSGPAPNNNSGLLGFAFREVP